MRVDLEKYVDQVVGPLKAQVDFLTKMQDDLTKRLLAVEAHDKSIGESDHDTVIMRLKIPDRMPTKAQWYYPNNLNKDPDFVKQHIEFLKENIPNIP